MKIKSLEIFKADLPLKDPLTSTFFGRSAHLNLAKDVVVKIASDKDYVGHGATAQVPPYHGMTQETILDVSRYLAPCLSAKTASAWLASMT